MCRRPRPASGVAALVCLAASALAGAHDSLPDAIKRVLDRHGLPADSISLQVVDTGTGEALLSHRADVARNPASAMKLVPTYAALDLLGPGFTWQTRYHAQTMPVDGVLDGDLIVVGGGDPMILVEDFLRDLFTLRQRGVRHITGDLVIDDRYFDESTIDTTPIDEQPERAYNAWPGSLVVNFRATSFVVTPRGNGIDVFADPPASTLRIDNRIEPVTGPCRERDNQVRLAVKRRDAFTEVRLDGRYGTACAELEIVRSVLEPDAYLVGVFKALWESLGGQIDGELVRGAAADDAPLLLERRSRPLAEVLRGVNKFSNNLMARSLLLTLGAEVYGPPGTVEAGRVAVRSWLNARSLSLHGLVIDNGAGLSRAARVTARGLSDLLQDALAHPYRDEFLSSLSLIGIDGSTERRLRDDERTGRYRLKTGLLRGVRAAAGYGLTRRGTQLVIVILQNSGRITYTSGNEVQDAVLGYVHERF